MALLIDTGGIELLRRGDWRAEVLVLQYFPPLICSHVAGEFLFGQINARVPEATYLNAQAFLETFEMLQPSLAIAKRYAQVRASLAGKGIMVSDPDRWVAAHALEENCPLLTTDRDFLHILGIRLYYLPPVGHRRSRGR